MKREIYKETQIIITLLQEKGMNNYSESLQDIVDYGSTGTEIIMGVRYELNNILIDKSFNDKLRIHIISLVKEIELYLL